jgi:hypothetical protein
MRGFYLCTLTVYFVATCTCLTIQDLLGNQEPVSKSPWTYTINTNLTLGNYTLVQDVVIVGSLRTTIQILAVPPLNILANSTLTLTNIILSGVSMEMSPPNPAESLGFVGLQMEPGSQLVIVESTISLSSCVEYLTLQQAICLHGLSAGNCKVRTTLEMRSFERAVH